MIYTICMFKKNDFDLERRSASASPHTLHTIRSFAYSQSSRHRAVQQKRRSSRATSLRTRQMHRRRGVWKRGTLQTPIAGRRTRHFLNGRLLLRARGTRLAVGRRGDLAHPAGAQDGAAGVFVLGHHGLAFGADVLGVHCLRLAG